MNVFIPQESIYIYGPTSYLPERIVDNRALIELTGSKHSKEMISFSTGIKQRHWAAENQACSDLAIESCKKLLHSYPELKEKISQILLATISGDFVSPPTSPHVLHQLGIKGAGAMDLGAACAGFVSGLHMASALAQGTKQDILLVASEIRSKFLNHKDFGTTVLFGDGAASSVVSLLADKADFRLLGSATFADGEIYDTISIPTGGSREPFIENTPLHRSQITVKNSSGLFVKAVHGMTEVAEKLLHELNLDNHDIDWLVPHQGNKHLVFSVAKQLNIPLEKTAQTVMSTGNTSGASNGIALAALKESRQLKQGQKVILTAAGGGGLAASAVIEVL